MYYYMNQAKTYWLDSTIQVLTFLIFCWRVTSPTISLALYFLSASKKYCGCKFPLFREDEEERKEEVEEEGRISKRVAFLMATFLSSSPLPPLFSSNRYPHQTPPSISLPFPLSHPLRATITANSRKIKTLILASPASSFDGFEFDRESRSADKVG